MNLKRFNEFSFRITLFLLAGYGGYFIMTNIIGEKEEVVGVLGDKYTDLINTTILKNYAERATIICTMNGFQDGLISIQKDDVFLFCINKQENNKTISQKFPLQYVEIMGEESKIAD